MRLQEKQRFEGTIYHKEEVTFLRGALRQAQRDFRQLEYVLHREIEAHEEAKEALKGVQKKADDYKHGLEVKRNH